MRHCIASVIEGDIQQYYLKMTRELSEKFGIRDISKKIPAHITLKYPFHTDDLTSAREKIRSVVEMCDATEFIVDGFDHFDRTTIFLSLRFDKTFDTRIRECVVKLGQFNEIKSFDSEKFVYHISLARHLNEDTFPIVWNYLHSLPHPHIKGMFDNISILTETDEVWHVAKKFEMKS